MGEQNKVRIQFINRQGHRGRQLDTIVRCPPEFDVSYSGDLSLQGVEQGIRRRQGSMYGRLRRWIAHSVAGVHHQRIPRLLGPRPDLLYLWGAFPWRCASQPYLLELDNPYVLTYYNVAQFRKYREVIRKKLLNPYCRQIICISEACKKNLLAELGDCLQSKISVLYPYVNDAKQHASTVSTQGTETMPTFLFAANDFYIKSGREVFEVFSRLNAEKPRARLKMITFLPDDFSYEPAPWFECLTAGLERSDFLKHLANADMLVHPSMQDSFGMVVLEAMACGVSAIVSDQYALPEITGQNANECIRVPLQYFNADYTAREEHWDNNFVRKITYAGLFDTLVEQLLQRVTSFLDPVVRSQHKKQTQERFRQRFAPTVRADAFRGIIERALHK